MLNLFRLSVGIPLCITGLHLVGFASRVIGEDAYGVVLAVYGDGQANLKGQPKWRTN